MQPGLHFKWPWIETVYKIDMQTHTKTYDKMEAYSADQQPANLRQFAADPRAPNRQHIHVVVRTPNGNDYGKDLLRQHYLLHPHAS